MKATAHFKPEEFDSPDANGSGAKKMKQEFIDRLEELRTRCGFAFQINSGYRTRAHNRKVGGVEPSVHEDGVAADIAAPTGQMKFAIVHHAMKMGFRRIGIGKTYVHVDMGGPSYPQDVIWLYS